MSTVDKIFLTIMSIALIAGAFFVSYSFGKKNQCELDLDYRYSYDFGKCVKIGVGNYK